MTSACCLLLHGDSDELADKGGARHERAGLLVEPRNLLGWKIQGDGAALRALMLHGLRWCFAGLTVAWNLHLPTHASVSVAS